MMRGALAGLLIACAGLLARPALAQEGTPPLPHPGWSFSGPFGTYDRAELQRGFLVYQRVCSMCHSMKELYYRNLEEIGLSDEQVKAIAASVQVPTLDDRGQPATRPGLPSDHFKSPFPNDLAARAANNGALPPDQSTLELARAGGPDYIYGILTGYQQPPAGMKMQPGMQYNKYFPGHQIAMPPPLQDNSVSYTDGTKPTLDQEAHDVTAFLTWASQPELDRRHAMGIRVVLYLVFLTGLVYAVKRKVWADVH